jgi:hypothetical protein
MVGFVQALAEVEMGGPESHSGGLAMKTADSLAWMQGLTPTRDHPMGSAYAGGSCDLDYLNAQQMKDFDPQGVTEKHAFWPKTLYLSCA